jgi:HEPN domain-containing protein
MQNAGRYLYVGFMCHQAIEKKLKGKFVKAKPEEDLPFIHNLVRLAKAAEIYGSLSVEQQKFLLELEPMNVEARYPRKKDEVYKSLTKERCEQLIKNTEELVKWLDKN